MAQVQIIHRDSVYDGAQIIGGSPDYPEGSDEWETPAEQAEWRQREWLHRHGLIIDDGCAELETLRW
jgi:hypothetical protein